MHWFHRHAAFPPPITAGIDLSVGANATFAARPAGGMLMNKGMTNPVVLLLVAIVGGTLIGWVNGMLTCCTSHPFVSTLGMKNVLWGGALIVTNLRWYPSPAMTLLCGSARYR